MGDLPGLDWTGPLRRSATESLLGIIADASLDDDALNFTYAHGKNHIGRSHVTSRLAWWWAVAFYVS